MAEQSWTDDPITAGSNRIRKKSIHFTELQDAITEWENRYSLANASFTDSPATGVKINTTVIIEMQDALDVLYDLATAGDPPFSWTPPTNLISNGNFDSNTTGWTPANCTITSVAGGQVGKCLQMTRTAGDYQDIRQWFTTVIGETYVVTTYVKSGTSGNERVDLYAWTGSISDGHIQTTSSGTWTKIQFSFTATDTPIMFIARKYTATAGTMLFDTVVAYKASVPIQPVHINELRTNMNIMQNDYCYQCDSCDTDTGCNLCNSTCYEETCGCYVTDYQLSCTCNDTCYGRSCSCNATCYSQGCKSDSCNCNGPCYGYSCSCNSTCYGYACTCDGPCYDEGCTCESTCYEDTCAHCDNSTYRYPWT